MELGAKGVLDTDYADYTDSFAASDWFYWSRWLAQTLARRMELGAKSEGPF